MSMLLTHRITARTGEAMTARSSSTLFIQVYCLMIALAFGLAGVIFFGGDVRFSGPTFAGPRNLIEWSGLNPRMAWGALFFVLSVALILNVRRNFAVHVLRFGLVVYTFLIVTFVWSAFVTPTAVLTGIVAYSVFAAAHLLLAADLEKYGWR